MRTFASALAILCLQASLALAADPQIEADLVLRGGTLVDGSLMPGVVGDLAIKGDTIVAVGKFVVTRVGREIDCRGLIVAPGFIDLHTHSDLPITRPHTRANTNYLTQGCTTVVTGNCGAGPVDVAAYFKKIDQAGAGTHVIHLLPHGSLRAQVMGQLARAPSDDELAEMKRLAEQAMRDGAFGMATGLIYIPGTFAMTEELIEIARVVGQHGGIYASHIRNEGAGLFDSIDEILTIGREANLPVHVSHFKAAGRDVWGKLRVAADKIEKARGAGQRVTADQYPYVASSTSLEATLLPDWSREGGREALKKRLADPAQRARIRAAIEQALKNMVWIQIAACDARRRWIGKSLDEIALADKRELADIVLDIEEAGGARIINFSMQEEDVRYAMRLPWVATASDGSAMIPSADQPHPRNFGTFSRKIGRYAIAQEVLPLEQAVRSASGLPADILGLTDRGYLQTGAVADVVAFDPQTYRDTATFQVPFRYSTGMLHVFVAGTPVIAEGVPTGALAGRVIRHAAKLAATSESGK